MYVMKQTTKESSNITYKLFLEIKFSTIFLYKIKVSLHNLVFEKVNLNKLLKKK